MGIMGLEPELTMRALLGRQVLRIKCCGTPMARRDAVSHLPDEDRPYGYSAVVLGCTRCGSDIELDLLLGSQSRERVWPALEQEEYPGNVTRRMNKKIRGK